MGTVKGDVHDIGKNLCNIMLEGAGFNVIDLGVNVPPEKFIEQIEEHNPDVVGFSAFLTTTMPMFKANINALEKAGLRDRRDRDGRRRAGHAGVRRRGRRRRLLGRRVDGGQEGEGADRAAAREGAGMSRHTGRLCARGPRPSRSARDQPFCIIGERINPTGRKKFAEDLRAGELSTVDARRAGAGRGRRGHARRQRRHPAGRRGRAARADAAHRPGHRRRADLHRLLGDRGARGRTVGLRGPGAGELGHRRGRAARGGAAAGRAPRRGRDRSDQRRDRDPGDARGAAAMRAQDRRGRRRTTGSSPTTS